MSTNNYLLAQERADHRQALDDYHTLSLKFRENPSEFSDEDRNKLINVSTTSKWRCLQAGLRLTPLMTFYLN